MKKILSIMFAGLMLVGLVACGGGKMKDGIYTAKVSQEYADAVGHGWADQLTVTYKDGVITEVVYDSFNADGTNKKEATMEEYPMGPPDFTAPSEWMPQLEENVKAAGSSDKVEAVAGATSGSDTVKALLAAIEKDGKPGETIIAELEIPAAA